MGSFFARNHYGLQCRRLLLCPTTDGNASSPRRTGHQQLGGSRIEAWMTEETLASVKGANIEAAKNPKLDTNSRLQCLYNIMLLPVKNYTARGFLWYQGESNLFNYQIMLR